METKELYFDLPQELIAQYPSGERGNDRLLCVNRRTGEHSDHMFSEIADLLDPGTLLVLNDSRVRKARVFAETENGGTVELLFLSANPDGSWNVMTNKRKRRRAGELLKVGSSVFELEKMNEDETAVLVPQCDIDENFFQSNGHVPLPPYIKREDEFSDESRYQTVYARNLGSVASPTAGLHYTEKILAAIKERGIEIAKVTLHVGMGTFLPLRSKILEEHKMHTEEYEISPESAEQINRAYKDGRVITASGTTSMRTLESAFDSNSGCVKPGRGATGIFITPGYKFKCVSSLVTNFHTPESTLLALVAAFSSLDIVKRTYGYAIGKKYRFFSYGDATYWY